jgi:hypothetical protein
MRLLDEKFKGGGGRCRGLPYEVLR